MWRRIGLAVMGGGVRGKGSWYDGGGGAELVILMILVQIEWCARSAKSLVTGDYRSCWRAREAQDLWMFSGAISTPPPIPMGKTNVPLQAHTQGVLGSSSTPFGSMFFVLSLFVCLFVCFARFACQRGWSCTRVPLYTPCLRNWLNFLGRQSVGIPPPPPPFKNTSLEKKSCVCHLPYSNDSFGHS